MPSSWVLNGIESHRGSYDWSQLSEADGEGCKSEPNGNDAAEHGWPKREGSLGGTPLGEAARVLGQNSAAAGPIRGRATQFETHTNPRGIAVEPSCRSPHLRVEPVTEILGRHGKPGKGVSLAVKSPPRMPLQERTCANASTTLPAMPPPRGGATAEDFLQRVERPPGDRLGESAAVGGTGLWGGAQKEEDIPPRGPTTWASSIGEATRPFFTPPLGSVKPGSDNLADFDVDHAPNVLQACGGTGEGEPPQAVVGPVAIALEEDGADEFVIEVDLGLDDPEVSADLEPAGSWAKLAGEEWLPSNAEAAESPRIGLQGVRTDPRRGEVVEAASRQLPWHARFIQEVCAAGKSSGNTGSLRAASLEHPGRGDKNGGVEPGEEDVNPGAALWAGGGGSTGASGPRNAAQERSVKSENLSNVLPKPSPRQQPGVQPAPPPDHPLPADAGGPRMGLPAGAEKGSFLAFDCANRGQENKGAGLASTASKAASVIHCGVAGGFRRAARAATPASRQVLPPPPPFPPPGQI
jgi:hypothetical protein